MSCSPPPPAAAWAATNRWAPRPSGCWARAASPASPSTRSCSNLRALVAEIEKDPAKFPEFKPAWRDSIAKESALFLGEIFDSGRGLAELLTAPFTFVDANLAPLYGVKAPGGRRLRAASTWIRSSGRACSPRSAFLARHGDDRVRPHPAGRLRQPGAPVPGPGAAAGRDRERRPMPPGQRANQPRAGHGHHQRRPCARPATTPSSTRPASPSRTTTLSAGTGPPRAACPSTRRTPTTSPRDRRASRTPSSSAGCWPRAPRSHDCYARNWFTYLQGRSLRPEDEPFVKWLAERSLGDRTSLRSLALTVVTDDSFLTRLP